MSEKNAQPQAEETQPTAELSAEDMENVAGGHVDENTSIWHDIGTGIRNAYDWITS